MTAYEFIISEIATAKKILDTLNVKTGFDFDDHLSFFVKAFNAASGAKRAMLSMLIEVDESTSREESVKIARELAEECNDDESSIDEYNALLDFTAQAERGFID